MMRAVVVGATPLALQVASSLEAAKYDVTVIQPQVETAEEVVSLPAVAVVAGDPLLVLEAAGALQADVLFSCTRSDADNLVVSYLAKKRFGVKRVVALANLTEDKWLFTKAWGVDCAVSAVELVVETILESATNSHSTSSGGTS